MTSLDHPRLRAWDICPLCAGRKSRGLVACWGCFNERDVAEQEAIYDRAEQALLQAARSQQLNPATGRPFPPQRGEDIGYGPDIDADGYDWRREDAIKAESATR